MFFKNILLGYRTRFMLKKVILKG